VRVGIADQAFRQAEQLEQGHQFGQRQPLRPLDMLELNELLDGRFRGLAQIACIEALAGHAQRDIPVLDEGQ